MSRKALLVYPEFPGSFWSYEESLGLVGEKANSRPSSRKGTKPGSWT